MQKALCAYLSSMEYLLYLLPYIILTYDLIPNVQYKQDV